MSWWKRETVKDADGHKMTEIRAPSNNTEQYFKWNFEKMQVNFNSLYICAYRAGKSFNSKTRI